MNEWITAWSGVPFAGAAGANTTLYKWLLGGGIVVAALAGLVFFGMLALHVLQQNETGAGVPGGEAEAKDGTAPPEDAGAAAPDERQQEEQA